MPEEVLVPRGILVLLDCETEDLLPLARGNTPQIPRENLCFQTGVC